jgi:ankyrin repeat protein
MSGVVFRKLAFAAAACAMLAGVPASAATDGYNFLKAVRDRDGTKATEMLNEVGNTFVLSKDESNGQTALHIVVQRRDELWTQFLLDRGARVDEQDKAGKTPLALAAGLGFTEGVALLVAHGARVDVPDNTGETPLIAAVHRRDIPMIRLLLKSGANIDRQDLTGRSARDYARLMGGAAGVTAEIERAEAERKGAGAQDAYGPSL